MQTWKNIERGWINIAEYVENHCIGSNAKENVQTTETYSGRHITLNAWMIIRTSILASFVHHVFRGQVASVTLKPRKSGMRAPSVLFLGQSMLKIAAPSVKCSISNLWVEGPERKGKIVVTQEVAAHAHFGSTSTPLHLPVFR